MHPTPRAVVLVPFVALIPFVVLVAVSTSRAQEGPAAVVAKTGRWFAVHCHGGDEALAQQALDAVEHVGPLVAAAFGREDQQPAQPLAVHLYRTVAGYEAGEGELTQGQFRRNLAMTHWDSKSAHVAVQPPCTDETLRAIGLPPLTIELLAWEACHVARYELCPNFRDHPLWLADGLGSSIGRQVLAKLRGGELADMPTASTDVVLVQRMQQQKKLPPASAILADRIDDLDFADRYAARTVFFQWLSSAPYAARLSKVLDVALTTGGGNDYGKKILAAARKTLGGSIDKDFAKYVQECRPRWREVFRSLGVGGSPWHQVAFAEKNAIAWCQDPVRGGGLSLRGKLRILPGGRQQLNVLVATGNDDDFYSVAFVADYGFTAFEFRSQQDAWQELGRGAAPALRLGYETTFAVAIDGKKLRVELEGLHWDIDLPRALPPEVLWGLGAQAGGEGAPCGSAGTWIDLRAAPAGK